MKISKIQIVGMHNAADKTYELNPGVTYFIGENGAGKSTILEAIQLALLGYVPGYNKTNEGIMRHSSGKFMEVTLTLDSGAVIDRTWMRNAGGSIKSEVNVTGYDGELSDLIQGVELPIFNFNEFTSLTTNKLKEWFIAFLPSAEGEVDLMQTLKDNLTNKELLSDELDKEVSDWISNSSLTGVDLVKALNAYLKENQSFVKGQISKLQGTIESLIHYDDVPSEDPEELNEKLNELNSKKTNFLRAMADHEAWDKSNIQIKLLKASLKADSYEEDPEVKEIKAEIDSLSDQVAETNKVVAKIKEELNSLELELSHLPKAAATCPYTREACETASKLASTAETKKAKLTEKIDAKRKELSSADSSNPKEVIAKINTLRSQLVTLQSKYNQLTLLQDQLGDEPTILEDVTLESIDEEIQSIQDNLVKVAANKRYNELVDQVTADKFAKENDLEVLKAWIKLTDANGLQTTMMDKPFLDLAGDMSTYLTQMFVKDTIARFNLTTKANSFSFGVGRDDKYIEFDCLSSGEKCLFTLAMMMCILDRSKSEIRTILVDDLLDHLDGTNAESLFKSLQKIDNMQFILAGVKECKETAICKAV